MWNVDYWEQEYYPAKRMHLKTFHKENDFSVLFGPNAGYSGF